jgi:hypothetical protein
MGRPVASNHSSQIVSEIFSAPHINVDNDSLNYSVAQKRSGKLASPGTTQLSNEKGFLDLPLEIILQIIEHLNEPVDGLTSFEAAQSITRGCLDMRDKWALKRTSRYFFAIKELHAPSDFFIRQYLDISLDFMKQQRLLGAFNFSLHSLGVLPCYMCKSFLPKEKFCLRNSAAPYFFEGRETTICIECRAQDKQIELTILSCSQTYFNFTCAICKVVQHNVQTLQCLCCHECKSGSSRQTERRSNGASVNELCISKDLRFDLRKTTHLPETQNRIYKLPKAEIFSFYDCRNGN